MPTYDYKCMVCSNTFELFQPMSAEPVKVCPECGGEVKRLIGTGAGTIFKGKGFYQTDYKGSAGSSESKVKKKTSESKPTKSVSDSPSGNVS